MSFYSRGRDFLFCHLCGTKLHYPSIHYAQCPLCKTKKGIKDREISYTVYAEEIRRELGISQIEDMEMKESTCNKTCEKCGFGVASYFTKQMRSADEGQTTYYKCKQCDHQFQEN
ncbi:unnamed protein product [Trifolium pratense]|uniref:Uncharacterized protein n=1 Tax=Trifolium pratense TaxID=57577 RepID=A0ACB0LAY8_TRIPR|nr:unnamed protein product [Trifolium pratense]